MDMNITNELMGNQGIVDGVVASFVYDVFKVALAFFIVRIAYDNWYMKHQWGGWHIQIKSSVEELNEPLLDREISSQVAKRILEDRGEFSVYVKGLVSPFIWLNIDVASKKAESIGLVTRNKDTKRIIIDISKNPIKEKKKEVKFSESTQKQINMLEKNVQIIIQKLQDINSKRSS